MYVTDTHSLVYFAEQKLNRLGKDARRIFREADDRNAVIYIPSVVLWEIASWLHESNFRLPLRFDHWRRSLEASRGFPIASLGWQDVDEAKRFPFKDPFDCLIVGTAVHLGMPLITKDAAITESGLIETVWQALPVKGKLSAGSP